MSGSGCRKNGKTFSGVILPERCERSAGRSLPVLSMSRPRGAATDSGPPRSTWAVQQGRLRYGGGRVSMSLNRGEQHGAQALRELLYQRVGGFGGAWGTV